MHVSVGSSPISRFAGAVAALWLCCTGSAWAGGPGGGDQASVQAMLGNSNGTSGLCLLLGMTSCPQLPTLAQLIAEFSALQNAAPDFVRDNLRICTVPGNQGFPVCSKANAINAVNPPAPSASLPDLKPLSFAINKQGQAVPVQTGDSSADSFFYVVATEANGQPATFDLLYDYPPLTSSTFTTGQVVGKISLPLQVLSTNGSERLVCGPQAEGSSTTSCQVSLATLKISAFCNGGPACLTANVFGDFSVPGTTEIRPAAALGLQFAITFGSSPNSSRNHAIFEVRVPLLVTGPAKPAQCGKAISAGTPDPADCGNDPAYFGVTPSGATNGTATGSPTGVNQQSGLATAFSTNVTPPANAAGLPPVGVAPYAAPACGTLGTACPAPLPSTFRSTFGFCASFWGGTVSSTLNAAVAAFATIGTDGTTYVTSPFPPFTGLQLACPF